MYNAGGTSSADSSDNDILIVRIYTVQAPHGKRKEYRYEYDML